MCKGDLYWLVYVAFTFKCCIANVIQFPAMPLPKGMVGSQAQGRSELDGPATANESLEPSLSGRPGEFKLHYDKLVIAVGAYSQSA